MQGGSPEVDRISSGAVTGASPDGIDFQVGGERVPVVVTPTVTPTPTLAGVRVTTTPAGLERACAPGHPRPPKGIVRTLKVVAKGSYRTVPKKGIVTGTDAAWTTTDTCDGSLVTVQKGRVTVKLGRKAHHVKRGERYLLRARLFGAR